MVQFISSGVQPGVALLIEQFEGLSANGCLIHHVECMWNIILKAFKWHLQVFGDGIML